MPSQDALQRLRSLYTVLLREQEALKELKAAIDDFDGQEAPILAGIEVHTPSHS
jgi:hypothetical protein